MLCRAKYKNGSLKEWAIEKEAMLNKHKTVVQDLGKTASHKTIQVESARPIHLLQI